MTKPEKRKYRGIADLYEVEDQLQEQASAAVVDFPQKESGRLPESGSLPEINRLPNSGSLLISDSAGCQNNSLPESGSLPDSNSLTSLQLQADKPINMMASLPVTGGYMRFWHQLTDHLYRQLSPSEQVVHLQLYRLSWGFNKPTCVIGLPNLAERSGVSRSTAQQAVNNLVKKGLIKKLHAVIGSGKDQGIEYFVEPPTSLPESGSLPNSNSLLNSGRLPKSNTIKENTKNKTHSHKSTLANLDVADEKNAAVRVSAGATGKSNFSLDQCLRYAENMKQAGKGINNPGGYATTIYRTGEADEMIAKSLEPVSVPPDISMCPDCRGTKYWYPEGKGKGVARCKHERLMTVIGNSDGGDSTAESKGD